MTGFWGVIAGNLSLRGALLVDQVIRVKNDNTRGYTLG